MRCNSCGYNNDKKSYFCVNCGAVLNQEEEVKTVSDRLVEAIAVTLFCCLPFGIVAIVQACESRTKLSAGDYEGAVNASEAAGKLIGWGFGIGFVAVLISVLIVVAFK